MAVWPLTTWVLWTGNAPSQGCVPLKISAVGSQPQVMFCGTTAMDTLAQLLDPGQTTLWRHLWVRESPSGGRYTLFHVAERTSVIFPCPVHGIGFYMMASTGANILSAGQTAVLVSPVHPGNDKTACVQFWYYIGGETPGETLTCKPTISGDRQKQTRLTPDNSAGSLTLYMKLLSGRRVKIFSNSLNQGDMWRHASGNISSGAEDWKVHSALHSVAFSGYLIASFHLQSLNLGDMEHLICSTVGIWGDWSWRQRELHCSRWHPYFSSPLPRSRFVSASQIWDYQENMWLLESLALIWYHLEQGATRIIAYNCKSTKSSVFPSRANMHIGYRAIKEGQLPDRQGRGNITQVNQLTCKPWLNLWLWISKVAYLKRLHTSINMISLNLDWHYSNFVYAFGVTYQAFVSAKLIITCPGCTQLLWHQCTTRWTF